MTAKRFVLFFAILSFSVGTSTSVLAQWERLVGSSQGYLFDVCAIGTDLFVGTTVGAFRSKDSGQSWVPANSGLKLQDIWRLEVCASNLFATTADSNHYFYSIRGDSWIPSGQGLPKNGMNGFCSAGASLFASVIGNGIYRSSDSGLTWTPSNTGIEKKTFGNIIMKDSQLFSMVLYGDLYASSDTGASWTSIQTGLLPSVYTLAVMGDYLFAAGGYKGLHRSSDNGRTWKTIETGLPSSPSKYYILANGGKLFATIDSGIYVSIDNGEHWKYLGLKDGHPDRMLVSGGSLYVGTESDGVFRSTDDGITWAVANCGLVRPDNIISLASNGSTLYAGVNDQGGPDFYKGVYRSTDNGDRWTKLCCATSASIDIPGYRESIQALTSDHRNVAVISGGHVFMSSDEGGNWRRIDTGQGLNWTYTLSLLNNELVVSSSDARIFHSTFDGNQWSLLEPLSSWATALLLTNSALFAGFNQSMMLSTDMGSTWTADTNGFNDANALALIQCGTTIYCATRSGALRSTDGGMSWSDIRSGLPTVIGRATLAIGSASVFMGTESGIFVLSKQGTSWINVTAGITDPNVYEICANEKYLFGGISGGVWRRPLSEMAGLESVTTRQGPLTSIRTYPNPFTRSTTISFASDGGHAKVSIVNQLGIEVARIFEGELAAGEHSFIWDASGMPAGMYESLVWTGGNVEKMRMVLVK